MLRIISRSTLKRVRVQTRSISSTPTLAITSTPPLDPATPTSTPIAPPPTPSTSYPSFSQASNNLNHKPTAESERVTHFGFQDVLESSKENLVKGVFSSVAPSYDMMNDAMSMFLHRLWKDHFVAKLNPHSGMNCLDVAGGTGDIALRILDHAKDKYSDRETKVHILDINGEMLEEGKKRFAKTMYHGGPQIQFTEGNAESLTTIPSSSIDLYTIAFGIRNCTHIDKVLEEGYRVLKPGGVFACLEFSKVQNPVLAKAYSLYSFNIIPALGHLLAGDRDSYQYLVESIERFPSQQEFSKMIEKAGFKVGRRERDRWENLLDGIAAIHLGVKV